MRPIQARRRAAGVIAPAAAVAYLLKPGEAFEYTSGCRLRTASGSMHGSYLCVAEDGEQFDCPIALFLLEADSGGDPGRPATPRVLH